MNNHCPSCTDKTWHTLYDLRKYHSLAGHGFNKEQGWTSLAAKELHEKEQLEIERNKKK